MLDSGEEELEAGNGKESCFFLHIPPYSEFLPLYMCSYSFNLNSQLIMLRLAGQITLLLQNIY